MKSLYLLINLLLIMFFAACMDPFSLQPVNRESEFRNFEGIFTFELPQGKEWYVLQSGQSMVAYVKKLEKNDHSFIASVHVSKTAKKFNTTKDFLRFVKTSRADDFDPLEFSNLQLNESIDGIHGKFCTKFTWRAMQEEKGILKAKGFSCLHPTYPQLIFTIQYSERSRNNENINEKVLNEGERFINSIKFN